MNEAIDPAKPDVADADRATGDAADDAADDVPGDAAGIAADDVSGDVLGDVSDGAVGGTTGDRVRGLADGAPGADDADAPPLADVVAFAVTPAGVEVGVVSTGCTTRDSIEARVERLDADTVALTLLRVRPDRCRRMPTALRFELGRDELGLGGEEIVLRNPVSRLPGRGGR